jgi:phage-related protein
MMNFFSYGGRSSKDFGVYISGGGTYNAPERDMTTYSVPGRNGDLLVDNGRFKNISVTYQSFIPFGFPNKAEQLRFWLKQNIGYQRLEDTYHPNFFRMGYMSNMIEFSTKALNRSAEFTLYFTCKPQRWLKTGEYPVTLNQSGETLYNAYMPALPLIKIYGNEKGTLVVNQTTVTVKNIDGYLMLDSDTQNAYKGTENQNINIQAAEFPVLQNGSNIIGWSGGIVKVDIIPRWWTV